jgi:hypothetical protein
MADPTIQPAVAAGRTSAAAGEGQRDLQRWIEQAPQLFPPRPFDATLLGTVSAANAFTAPDLPASALTMLNRGALWGFAVDWQIDFLATGAAEVAAVVERCRAVGGGAPPTDGLTELLAQLREQIATAPATLAPGGGELANAWAAELAAMLTGMRREWRWRNAQQLPTVDKYLANADNLGSAFVNLGHWIVTTPDADPTLLPLVKRALRAEQKVIRLLNDLGTYDRDRAWGDLNALLLGLDRDEVLRRVDELVARTRTTLAPLADRAGRLADFLRRQIGFCAGFYGVTDYWGDL